MLIVGPARQALIPPQEPNPFELVSGFDDVASTCFDRAPFDVEQFQHDTTRSEEMSGEQIGQGGRPGGEPIVAGRLP